MISRLWHGWTTRANANAYEQLLREEVLPGIHRVRGFKGAHVLRRESDGRSKSPLLPKSGRSGAPAPGGADEIEFIVITQFDSIDDVTEFAGEDYELAVIEPAARKLLARFDARSAHYETVMKIE